MAGELKSPVGSSRKQWDTSAVGTDDYLASLTRRLDLLEKKLVGKRGVREGYPPLYPAIKTCQEKLEGSLDSANQAGVHTLWNKMDALERLLDPAFSKTGHASQSVKEDLLVGYVGQLKAVSGKVEELQQLKDYINSTEFQGLDTHERKLAGVANVHSQQEQTVEDVSRQVQELLKAYSEIILQLSAQCVAWGEQVAKLET